MFSLLPASGQMWLKSVGREYTDHEDSRKKTEEFKGPVKEG